MQQLKRIIFSKIINYRKKSYLFKECITNEMKKKNY